MGRSIRQRGRTVSRGARAALVGAVLTAGLATGVASAPAQRSVADNVPRPPGAIEDRGWELVSPSNANGMLFGTGMVARAGEAVAMWYLGGVGDSSVGIKSYLVAHRTETGWQTHSLLPSSEQALAPSYGVVATNAELTSSVLFARKGFIGSTSPESFLVRQKTGGLQTLLQAFGPPATFAGFVASDDLSKVFDGTNQLSLGFGETPGRAYVYEYGSGTPQLVSRLPGNGVPACGVTSSGMQDFGVANATRVDSHVVSSDGNRVFFHSSGDVCSNPSQLYMRNLAEGTTTLISGPPSSGASQAATFLQASATGSQVTYMTATNLVPQDTDGTPDIYRYTIGQGNACLTCGGPVPANVTQPDGGGRRAPLVSEDGSRIYFHSASALVPGQGTGDARDIYLWHSNGAISFVSPSDGLALRPGLPGDDSTGGAETTPDGRVLIFRSNKPELNAMTGRNNGGHFQYYRYDDAVQAIQCISCPSAVSATEDVPGPLVDTNSTFMTVEGRHAMTSDGNTVAFVTYDALVPQDVNHDADIYEWHDGEIGLITDGTSTYPEPATLYLHLVDVSGDGRNILFSTTAKLTPEVSQAHPLPQLYTARLGGGFPATERTSCAGDGCQGQTPNRPELLDPSTELLVGAGNLVPPLRLLVRRIKVHKSIVVLTIKVPSRGLITVSGPGVGMVTQELKKAGVYRVHVQVKLRIWRLLKNQRHLVLRLGIGYQPAGSAKSILKLRVPVKGR